MKDVTLQDFRSILHDEVSTLPHQVQREEKEFMVESIGLCENFWEREILREHLDKYEVMYLPLCFQLIKVGIRKEAKHNCSK